jgi:hypothetical protein
MFEYRRLLLWRLSFFGCFGHRIVRQDLISGRSRRGKIAPLDVFFFFNTYFFNY